MAYGDGGGGGGGASQRGFDLSCSLTYYLLHLVALAVRIEYGGQQPLKLGASRFMLWRERGRESKVLRSNGSNLAFNFISTDT